jgi:hypothetical protein
VFEKVDDPTVVDECRLLRRIPIQPNTFILWNENEGRWTISSAAFQNNKGFNALSVNIESIMRERQLSLDVVIRDPKKYSLAAITAGLARQHDQVIQKHPEADDPSHGHVVGEKSKPIQRALANAAQWVVAPNEFLAASSKS